MSFVVSLTQDTVADLQSIYDYIIAHDSPSKADYVIDEIKKVIGKLATFPERGMQPTELLAIGIMDFREVYFKPYRIVYQIKNRTVYVMFVVDGRRNLQTILLRRLLGHVQSG
ncbi:MAG: type II toxin-antitoxin system RelE/ParE family toxin [Thermoguttaceae bacterium]